MSVFITGVAGFIGSNLTEMLVSKEHKVIGIDNFDPLYPRAIKERNLDKLISNPLFQFYEIDIKSIVFKQVYNIHQ